MNKVIVQDNKVITCSRDPYEGSQEDFEDFFEEYIKVPTEFEWVYSEKVQRLILYLRGYALQVY